MKKIIATLTALATLAIARPIQSSAYCGELYTGDADHIDVCYWEYTDRI